MQMMMFVHYCWAILVNMGLIFCTMKINNDWFMCLFSRTRDESVTNPDWESNKLKPVWFLFITLTLINLYNIQITIIKHTSAIIFVPYFRHSIQTQTVPHSGRPECWEAHTAGPCTCCQGNYRLARAHQPRELVFETQAEVQVWSTSTTPETFSKGKEVMVSWWINQSKLS